MHSEVIESEFYDLMQMLHANYDIDSIFGLDEADINQFKKYIAQIKINALSEVKKDIQNSIIKTTQNSSIKNPHEENITILIKEAVNEYMNFLFYKRPLSWLSTSIKLKQFQ